MHSSLGTLHISNLSSVRKGDPKRDVMPAEEGVKLKPGAMETLGKVAGGDMRKAITTLQSAVRLKVRCAISGGLSIALQ